MRLPDLFESPVVDFVTKGFDDFDPRGKNSFRHPADMKAVHDPKNITRIKQKFTRTPFGFRLYFYNIANYDLSDISAQLEFFDKHSGEVSSRDLQNFGIDVQAVNDAITVIFVNNEGTSRLPLTPWIIAHRFGHAVYETEAFREFEESCDREGEKLRALYQRHRYFESAWEALLNAATMKSVRSGKLVGDMELYYEFMAQFIITGGIALRRSIQGASEKFNRLYGGIVDQVEYRLNQAAERCLSRCVGKMFLI